VSNVDRAVIFAPQEQSSLTGEKDSSLQFKEKDTLSNHRLDNQANLKDMKILNVSSPETGTVTLPALTLTGTDSDKVAKPTESSTTSMFSNIWGDVKQVASTATKVGEQLFDGAADEVIHHPGTLLKDAAIGAATGAAMTFLPALVVPALAVAGYELIKNREAILNDGKEFVNDVEIVNDFTNRSATETEKANESLMGFGRAGAEVVAGIAGGVAGSMAMRVAIAARAASASVQAVQVEQNALGVASQTGAEHIQYTNSGLVDENGIFSDFKFQPIDHSRVLDFKDTWQFNGSKGEVEADLEKAGFQRWRTGFHFGDEEWRLPADARGSIHFNIGSSIKDAVTGALKTIGSVHGYEFDPGTHMVQHFLHDVVRV
jgi:hypothetical protein